jgi:hypothetical protein
MYKVGELGDCFFLTIKNNKTVRHMLIDCGSFRNSDKSAKRMKEIATEIKKEINKTKGRLDVVVGTHQHNDHVSGFVHAEKEFRGMKIDQVWLSWLDDPKSKEASSIAEGHSRLRSAMMKAFEKMSAIIDNRKKGIENTRISEVRSVIGGVLGFFGDEPELPAQGIKILKEIGANDPEYLSPGELKTITGIPASEVRIHVLGPPTNEKLLFRKDPKKGESYDMRLKSMYSMAGNFLLALDNLSAGKSKEEEQFPFNREFKRFRDNIVSPALKDIAAGYEDPDHAWRNIDDDWMDQAARLALYMDSFTNNSSLVIAIELVKTGKVLLFAADAQAGNWVSWQDVVFQEKSTSLDSLLERTVFYKVGHHGSENATLKNVLEKMTHQELVAMIPVDKTDGNIDRDGGWKMPAKNLYQRLKEKTGFRVLRMDDGFADDCDPAKSSTAKASWNKLKAGKPKVTKSFIEFTVS